MSRFVELLATEEATAYVATPPQCAGGSFRHGTYDFELPLPAINEVRRYRISFYENGEWRKDADRFKWVTAPGRGVAPGQIVSVLHELEQEYTIGGLQLRESTYLLLSDGSAYEDLRCPPDQLDVLTSRKREIWFRDAVFSIPEKA